LNSIKKYFIIRNHFVRELLAEFMGTAFLIFLGEAAGATQTLSRTKSGNVVSTNLSWGFGVFFAILMAGNVTGGLFNPAITITWALLGRVPWKKVLPYCLAEVAGAFFGAAVVFALYYDAINAFDGGVRQIDGDNGTAGIFATYPLPHISTGGAFFDQIIGTCSLVIAVLAATDANNGLPPSLVPFAVAFYVMVNGFTFSYNCGGAINPARDLGPRLLTLVAGYGWEVFSYRNYTFFWIPVVGPIVGGIVGATVYQSTIGLHWQKKKSDAPVISPLPSLLPGSLPNASLAKAFANEAFLNNIYLSQQSLDISDSIGKRDSVLPLVR